ncbi:MAG: MFS transporter [Marinobacter sp.]|uniref:MFS transporter n=1 Tax=Marinobacter sp. TaxID=50741 RepID=UPI00299EAE90|nr:MFS transporter [Marinobacter sp.]MDX1755391.1 MFS transporter [Marinobacter sp.]
MSDRTAPVSVDHTSLIIVLPLTLAAFFTAFACWTLFAVVGVELKNTYWFSDTQFALLLSVPFLTGGLLAPPLGMLTQRWGGRRVILVCLPALGLALLLLMWVDSYAGFLLAGAGLGTAGGLFSAGLHYLVTYMPPSRAGMVLGMFGIGTGGAGFSYLVVPVVQTAYSWELAPLAYLSVILLVWLLLLILTDPEPSPRQRSETSWLRAVKSLVSPSVWPFCLYFSFLFGGSIALILWLPDYLSSVYQLSLAEGARWSLLCALPMLACQVPGGLVSDRYGAVMVLRLALLGGLGTLFLLSYPDTDLIIHGIRQPIHWHIGVSLPWLLLLLSGLSALMGSGMGALLRLLFDEYPQQVGTVGGLMLACACASAFLLPLLFGLANDFLSVRSSVFMLLFLLCLVAWLTLECSRHPTADRKAPLP